MGATAKLSSKGQLIVPKSIRDARGWEEGTELEFRDGADGVIIAPVQAEDDRFPVITVDEFLQRVTRVTQAVPTEQEIEQIVLEEAGRRFDATSR